MKLISAIKAVVSVTLWEAQRFIKARQGKAYKRAYPLTTYVWEIQQAYYVNLEPTIYSLRAKGMELDDLDRKYGAEAVEYALYDNDPLIKQ